MVREPGLTPAELTDRAGVSERTLRRDLAELRRLGYEVAFDYGYQLADPLELEGDEPHSAAAVLERQLELVRRELPSALADQVVADLEALAPAVFASLLATVIERRLNRRG